MSDDWNCDANAPTFTLFKKVTPEEAAESNGFIDIIVYNRWSKAERRLYQKLKAEAIAKQIAEETITEIDTITSTLESLNFLRKDNPDLDGLIEQVEQLKIKSVNKNQGRN